MIVEFFIWRKVGITNLDSCNNITHAHTKFAKVCCPGVDLTSLGKTRLIVESKSVLAALPRKIFREGLIVFK